MFLSKSKSGKYCVVYQKKDGRRGVKSTKTKYKKDALKFLTNFQREQDIINSQVVEPITLRDFQFHYFRYAEPIHTPKTILNFKTTFNALKKYFGNPLLTELTTKRLEEYLYHRLKNSSIYGARRDYAHLSSVLNKAINDGYLLENPIRKIRPFKIPQKQPVFYSKSDFQKLIDAIDKPDLADLVNIAVRTGLRQMELLKLEWNQVDLEHQVIRLDNRNHLTKSKRIRNVPLTDSATGILKVRNLKASNFFVFTLNDREIKQDFITHEFKKYVRKAKLNDKLNFHSLRHTYASWLVQKGVSLYIVSRLLGHSNISTTEIYAHLRTEDLHNATRILDGEFC